MSLIRVQVAKLRARHAGERKNSFPSEKPRPGWAPDPLMVGIKSPDGLVVGLAPTTLEFGVRFPNERNQGKQAHPVLKYLVPHRSHAHSFVIDPAVIKHTPAQTYPYRQRNFSPLLRQQYSLAKCIWIGQLLVEGFSSDGHRSVETNFRNRLFSNNLVWNCNSKAVRNADSTRDCSKNSDLAKSFRI